MQQRGCLACYLHQQHSSMNIEMPVLHAIPVSGDAAISQADLPLKRASKARNLLARLIFWMGSVIEWICGALTLTVTLAVLSVIPVLNFLSLGYLLEASGRVARTRHLRAGFVGVRKAAVFGRIIVGTWLVLWPTRFIWSMAQ